MPTNRIKAAFIEPMLLMPTDKLPEGDDWAYELLCGGPHKSSFVAFGVMWLANARPARKKHDTASDAT